MKVEITKVQLRAIIDMADDMSGMLGGGDDEIWKRNIKAIDRFLKKNGFKRNYT